MRLSKTEVNLRRLLEAAPKQQNQAKLVHYVATLRELLEQLGEETTSEGLPSLSKAKVNDYSEKIEVIASKLVAASPENSVSNESLARDDNKESSSEVYSNDHSPHSPHSPGLRRRHPFSAHVEDRSQDVIRADTTSPVKMDAKAHAHIEKHRKLQDNLTDEMVELAQQLKERSLVMSQSLQNTEKVLDSTEKAVEDSLARTGHVNTRAMTIYSDSFKTTCFTWLMIFAMTCIFIMVVLLIRVT